MGAIYIRVWYAHSKPSVSSEQLEIVSEVFEKKCGNDLFDSIRVKKGSWQNDYTIGDLAGGPGRSVWLFKRVPKLAQLFANPINQGVLPHLRNL